MKFESTHASPQQLYEQGRYEQSQASRQKVELERVRDAGRLQRRRIERTAVRNMQLQTRSRQKCASISIPRSGPESQDNSRLNLTVVRPEPSYQLDLNLWTNIDNLPVTQLRKHISPKELELDARAIEDLSDRRDMWRASLQLHTQRIDQLQDLSRLELARRHEEIAEVSTRQLEKKAGVIKIKSTRWNSVSPQRLTPRGEVLSRPKQLFQPSEDLLYPEFRGLLHNRLSSATYRLDSSLPLNRLHQTRPSLPTNTQVTA